MTAAAIPGPAALRAWAAGAQRRCTDRVAQALGISPDRAARAQQVLLELGLEVLIVVVFLKAYNLVRNQFGSIKCTPEYALGHAQQIIHLERVLGIFWEQEIQAVFLGWRPWIRFWNIFYGAAHTSVTVVVLGYLFVTHPAAYQRCRNVFILMNLLAITGYAGWPLMPPRLVNACDDPYGGCQTGYTFVDTLHEYGGLWSWKDKGVSKLSNHYAAMPSMHAGYATWCATSLYSNASSRVLRRAALLYPVLTLYCIVVTANHYFMDAVCGVAAFLIATKLGPYMPRTGRGAGAVDGNPSHGALAGVDGEGEGDEKARLLALPVSNPPAYDAGAHVELAVASKGSSSEGPLNGKPGLGEPRDGDGAAYVNPMAHRGGGPKKE